jgi:hypothetical protein
MRNTSYATRLFLLNFLEERGLEIVCADRDAIFDVLEIGGSGDVFNVRLRSDQIVRDVRMLETGVICFGRDPSEWTEMMLDPGMPLDTIYQIRLAKQAGDDDVVRKCVAMYVNERECGKEMLALEARLVDDIIVAPCHPDE